MAEDHEERGHSQNDVPGEQIADRAPVAIEREKKTESPDFGVIASQPYSICAVKLRPFSDWESRYRHWAPAVRRIVETEWPVHEDLVARRIAEGGGVSFSLGVVNLVRTAAIQYPEIERKGRFLWVKGKFNVRVRDRSGFRPSEKKIEFVAPEEIEEALLIVVEGGIRVSLSDAFKATLNNLGFRATQSARDEIERVLRRAESQGRIRRVGDSLELP